MISEKSVKLPNYTAI